MIYYIRSTKYQDNSYAGKGKEKIIFNEEDRFMMITKRDLILIIFSTTFCIPIQAETYHLHNLELKKQSLTTSFNGTEKIPTITIWIHGARLVPNFAFRKFFYKPLGLKKIKSIDKKYHIRKIADRLIEEDPKRFCKKHFYIFGWSGKVNFIARKEAAQELYNKLEILVSKYYKKYNCIPHIRLITHSHGGNVALNSSLFKKKENHFKINELILLACPVQEATKQLIEDPFFERCYSFFSKTDIIQIIDPQGLYRKGKRHYTPFFSERHFPYHKKLTQARIKINGRSLFHIEFLLKKFVTNLPAILNKIEHKNTKSLLVLNLKNKGLTKKTTFRPKTDIDNFNNKFKKRHVKPFFNYQAT